MFKLIDKHLSPLDESGLWHEQNWLLLKRLEDISNNGIIFKRFTNLAAINNEIKNPIPDSKVIVTGQGEAHYKEGTGWVLSSNDTTAVV